MRGFSSISHLLSNHPPKLMPNLICIDVSSAQLPIRLSNRPQKPTSNLLFLDMASIKLPLRWTVHKNLCDQLIKSMFPFAFLFLILLILFNKVAKVFFPNNSQQYLPYTGSFMCDGKRKVCTNVGWISLFTTQVGQFFKNLKEKEGFLNSQIFSTVQYLSNSSPRYHNNYCWMSDTDSLISITISWLIIEMNFSFKRINKN